MEFILFGNPTPEAPPPRRGEPVEGREVGGSQKKDSSKAKNKQNNKFRAHFEKCTVSFPFPHSSDSGPFSARALSPDEHTQPQE